MRAALLVIVACTSGKQAPDPSATATPPPALTMPAPAPAAPAPRFKLLTQSEQKALAAKLIATFPASSHVELEVDMAGFVERLVIDMPGPIADGELLERTRAFLGEHRELFGIRDPAALHGEFQYNQLWLGEGDRWTGKMSAFHHDRRLHIDGHLWPVETPELPTVDKDVLLAPYYGLTGSRPSKCCDRDDPVVTNHDDFVVRVGVAMVCSDGFVSPRVAIAVEDRLGSARVEGIRDMPALYDARTREPIAADFIMPPTGAGKRTYTADYGQQRAGHRCFPW